MHTLLVIEDDHDTRVAFRLTLEEAGYRVYTAPNGLSAIELLSKISRPSLILLDQNMPLMSGDEFLRRKNEDSKIASIPVIIVSAVENRASSNSTVGYLRKPVRLPEFLKVIEKYCPKEISRGMVVDRVFVDLAAQAESASKDQKSG